MRISVQTLTRIALLASLCIVLRFAFGAFPNIKPVTAIFLVVSIFLGPITASFVMGLTMLGTSFLMGFGPWVVWQVAAYMLLILIWQLVLGLFSKNLASTMFWQASFAAVLCFFYGFLMSVGSHFTYGTSILAYWLNGLFFDGLHAVSTFLFYPVIFYIFRRLINHEKNIF